MASLNYFLTVSFFLWYSISTMNDEVLKKLNDHEEQLDAIARTVVDHTERLDRIEENMVTKKDHQEVMNALDKLIRISEKKDQELIKPLVGLA